jgi:hypothetical protein
MNLYTSSYRFSSLAVQCVGLLPAHQHRCQLSLVCSWHQVRLFILPNHVYRTPIAAAQPPPIVVLTAGRPPTCCTHGVFDVNNGRWNNRPAAAGRTSPSIAATNKSIIEVAVRAPDPLKKY